VPFRLLADAVVLLHLAFVAFVVAGGFLALRWRRLVWLHVPAALWGVAIELGGWVCPLTPLEQALREAGGGAGYPGGFIEHYLLPVLYPPGLTRAVQLALGLAVLAVNAPAYALLWRVRGAPGPVLAGSDVARKSPAPGEAEPATLAYRLARPLRRFLAVEAASSLLLLAATLFALAAANSGLREAWERFWQQRIALEVGRFELALSLAHWVNDALMAVFFFVVGLEIKRELTIGELASRERAMLPVFGALGGMIAPALLYLLLQPGAEARAGWGIPMATDIAFAVAALALFGPRVPPGLKVFLLALAIVDDLGAVTVIAVFYTGEIRAAALFAALLGLGLVHALRLAGVRAYAPYFAVGSGVWLATLSSGVHPTVAGVMLGLLTPVHALGERATLMARLRERAEEALHRVGSEGPEAKPEPLLQQVRDLSREAASPLEYLTQRLHPWVAFGAMPVFALANAGVPLEPTTLGDPLGLRVTLAVVVGLVIGKPLGIALFSLAAVRLRLAALPRGVGPGELLGAGLLGGIGFSMALFITALAFGEGPLASAAKVGVLSASALACALGVAVLWRALPRPERRS
jgi:NhaA family Na+:H+ antiporter